VLSPNKALWLRAVAALLLLADAHAGTPLPLSAADPTVPRVPAANSTPDQAEIDRALEKLQADPNLAAERTIRSLKWVDKQSPPDNTSISLEWLVQLMGWIAQSARIVVWVAAALLVGLLGIYVFGLLRERRPSQKNSRATAPTHVQDLDIRPESLPDNIGAAARSLWDGGEHRAALSLLYRGLLSRLVHVHEVPIRDSSTEGDCLQLTATRLKNDQRSYVTGLIRVWQHAVYGGQQPDTAELHELCDGFGPSLDAA
jgi:hypothetical protein